MTRTTRLGLATLLISGCTADFFVGPQAGGSTGADASTGDASTTAAGPTTSEGSGATSDTTLSDASTSSSSGEAIDPDSSSGSSSGTSSTTTADTETPPECSLETAKLCEAALPTCWWTGELCMENPCDVGGPLDCAEQAPNCVWEADFCIPSGCAEEAECSPLELGVCEGTDGCIVVAEQCYALACVPCHEVDDPGVCQELPNCDYDALRGACLPL